jgi:hypothetical protein
MKIWASIKTGFIRTIKSSGSVIYVWFCMFLMVLIFVHPLKNSLQSAFGSSMITDRLVDGFDFEVFADLGSILGSILSFVASGFMLLFVTGFILNSFLTAGLFRAVSKNKEKFSSQEFFRSCSANFWPFMLISLVITVIIAFVSIILISVPMIIISLSETMSEKSAYTLVVVSVIILLLLVPVSFLITDYARAWKAVHENNSVLRAISFGFGKTLYNSWSAYFMMALLTGIQLIFLIAVLFFMPLWRPTSDAGLLLMFIVSQLLLYTRLLLKTWRYASVTSMMEITTVQDI